MIDLSTWNLTTPEAEADGSAKTYSTLELQTLDNEFFARRADGSIVFHAPVAGATTANTDRTRSELRETNPDGTLRNWTIGGDHRLRAALQVMRVPSNESVCIGQIHSKAPAGDPLLKILHRRGVVLANVRQTPDVAPVSHPIMAVPLFRRFTYSVRVTPDAGLEVFIGLDGSTSAFKLGLIGWNAVPLYFKAGVYNQDPTEDTIGEASTAQFWRIEVVH